MNSSHPAKSLFERIPSEAYRQEWTEEWIQAPTHEEIESLHSVLVFRLGKEFLAIRTSYIKEVAKRRKVHKIPHRSGEFLLGIVNLNGELQLYAALHHLLEIEALPEMATLKRSPLQERMIAIGKEGEVWVFPVDGVEGIFNWNFRDLENVPVTVKKSRVNYLQGIMKMENKSVALLDEELLFASLKRSLT